LFLILHWICHSCFLRKIFRFHINFAIRGLKFVWIIFFRDCICFLDTRKLFKLFAFLKY
jgi:hypothetical protein